MTGNKGIDTRADVIIKRTYSRPNEQGNYESWNDIVARVINHQRWLWERAKGSTLQLNEIEELKELQQLMIDRKVLTSGRTLWLGGTDIAKTRESSQFNCSFTKVETVYDVVDVLWLLLQGCGVGFSPVVGTLNGFAHPIPEIEIIRSTKVLNADGTYDKGREANLETFVDGVWTISIGDSAESWAKSIGKLLAGKYKAKKLVFDFSNLRPAGIRLKGSGWISSGDSALAKAYEAIAKILNQRAGQLLTRMDILDVVNWLGTVLSSRRSAQIALFEYGEEEWKEFALAKKEWWLTGNSQRIQSNNSLTFQDKPSREQLMEIFGLMEEAGGSEPGFVNAQTAKKRARWFYGSNPCCEILLGNKTFCNLMEIDIAKFRGNSAG